MAFTSREFVCYGCAHKLNFMCFLVRNVQSEQMSAHSTLLEAQILRFFSFFFQNWHIKVRNLDLKHVVGLPNI